MSPVGEHRKIQRKKPEWTEIVTEIWVGQFLVVDLLFPGFKGFSGISAAKTWTFYALAGELAVFGVCFFLYDLKKKKLRRPTPTQIAALAFLACTLVSAAFSPYGAKAWYNEKAHEAALTLSLYVLVFLIVSRWGKPTKRLFWVLFGSLTAFCLLCLLQALGENPLRLYPKTLTYYDGFGVKYKGAYAGTIGNVDIVSAFLALVVPMLIISTIKQRPARSWPAWILAAACLAILLWIRVLCGPVGMILGAAVCGLVFCPAGKRRWVLLAYGTLAVAGLLLLFFIRLPEELVYGDKYIDVLKPINELQRLLHGEVSDTFGSGRFYIWRQMLERIPDRLWTGVGPDMVRFSGLSPFIRYDENGVEVARATLTDGHCYPLHVLYCQGLPALLSWLGVVGISLYHWVRYRGDRAVAILGGGLICFLCAMLFCISSVIVMPFFWLTLGLLNANAKNGAEA